MKFFGDRMSNYGVRDGMETELKDTCEICERVRWGNYQYLGHSKWRHEECYPGSEAWVEYYTKLPAEKRTDAGNLLLLSAV